MGKWWLLILGGSVGTLARYSLSTWISITWKPAFPYATLVVNVVGCLLIGIVGAWAQHGAVSPHLRLLLAVGFLGAFTTFSTLEYESFLLLTGGALSKALMNLGGSIALGLLAVWVGHAATTALLKT